MKKITNKLKQINLDGYKTYIAIALMILSVVLYSQGYITEETFNLLDTIFLALIGFSLRDAIKKK
jgi:hypothetical protein